MFGTLFGPDPTLFYVSGMRVREVHIDKVGMLRQTEAGAALLEGYQPRLVRLAAEDSWWVCVLRFDALEPRGLKPHTLGFHAEDAFLAFRRATEAAHTALQHVYVVFLLLGWWYPQERRRIEV